MSRWRHQKEQFTRNAIYEADGDWIGDAINKLEAEKLVNTHNADCDAYEARIADLEEKLSAYKKYEAGINAFGTLEYLYISDREGAKREDESKSLKSELARVKAESLRVVEEGEAVELAEVGRGQKFLFAEYGVCEVANPGQYDRTSDVRVLSTGEIITSEKYGVRVQPVRLARLEDVG